MRTHHVWRAFVIVAAFTLTSCASMGYAAAKVGANYVDPAAFNFKQLLPQPPADDSAATRRELDAMLRIQERRTDSEVALAQADVAVTLDRFAAALGSATPISGMQLPHVSELFRKIGVDQALITNV